MPRCRPFKLIDAMILIAAAAVWMARMRPLWNQLQMGRDGQQEGHPLASLCRDGPRPA